MHKLFDDCDLIEIGRPMEKFVELPVVDHILLCKVNHGFMKMILNQMCKSPSIFAIGRFKQQAPYLIFLVICNEALPVNSWSIHTVLMLGFQIFQCKSLVRFAQGDSLEYQRDAVRIKLGNDPAGLPNLRGSKLGKWV